MVIKMCTRFVGGSSYALLLWSRPTEATLLHSYWLFGRYLESHNDSSYHISRKGFEYRDYAFGCHRPDSVSGRELFHLNEVICEAISLPLHWARLYFDLLPRNQAVVSNVYCRQLSKMTGEDKKKHPELANRKVVMFYHDNTRPHTSLMTR